MDLAKTIVPIKHLCEKLNCSRPFVYRLIKDGCITPYYFRGGATKAYFDLEEVYSSLKAMPDKGVKRKNHDAKV